MGGKAESKAAYFEKLRTLLDEYKTIFVVGIDNVSSQQMHEIRLSLRGDAVVLMGKNTMVCLPLSPCVIPAIDPSPGSPRPQGLHLRQPDVGASPPARQG